ncbi:MAG: glycosyltransferase family 39 protein [Planctomycetes bacterium]|nr:glycosyltransferase family 39 protein [Planctomycetota bacterium]
MKTRPINEPAARTSRSTWFVVVLLVACTTHGTTWYWSLDATTPNRVTQDAAEYLALGRSLSAAGSLTLPTGDRAKRMPVFPMLVAAVHRVTGDAGLESGVLTMQAVLSLCTTLTLALTAWRIAGPVAGTMAGLSSATYGSFIYLQTLCLTEPLLIFLLSLAVLLFVRRTNALTIGVLLAIASLTRANAAILILPFVAESILESAPWKRRTIRGIALVLPAALCLTFWGMRNVHKVGAFTLSTTGGLNFYLGHNPDYATDPGLGRADYGVFDRLRAEGRSEIEADRQLTRAGKAWAADHPGEVVTNLWRKLATYHSSTLHKSAPTLVLLMFFAVAVQLRSSARRGTLSDRAKRLYGIAWLGAAVTLLAWLIILQVTLKPWINPTYLVPIGLIAVVLLPRATGVRRLFIGLYVAEMLVGLAFIPLVRLRWTVDGLLIIAVSVVIARFSHWLTHSRKQSRPSLGLSDP